MPAVIIPVVFILKNLYEKYIISLNMPCFFHLLTGYWCPGCGGTRSVLALFDGNIISSLKYNPAPVIIITMVILGYIQIILNAHGSRHRILPRNDNYIIIIVAVMLIYYLLRNFMPVLEPSFS